MRRAALFLVVLAAAAVAPTLVSSLGERGAARGTGPVAPFPSPAGPEPLVVFGASGRVELHLVSPRVIAVAYHEASLPGATRMEPRGRCVVCRNPSGFHRPRPTEGPDYIVMDTRGRPYPATSAVDLVVPRGADVLSPVTGTVAEVRRYKLYGRYPDLRVAIDPIGGGGRQVVMIHLRRVQVRAGDPVVASGTVLGLARRFPFESQVDRYVPGRHPHVHLEVKRGAAPTARRGAKDAHAHGP